MTLDILCCSARPAHEIINTFNNYISIANNVIVSRHPEAPSLPKELFPGIKILKNSPLSELKRMHALLRESSADLILLGADDDFYTPSTCARMHDKYLNNLSFSDCRITLELAKNNKQQIHIKPYLIRHFLFLL